MCYLMFCHRIYYFILVGDAKLILIILCIDNENVSYIKGLSLKFILINTCTPVYIFFHHNIAPVSLIVFFFLRKTLYSSFFFIKRILSYNYMYNAYTYCTVPLNECICLQLTTSSCICQFAPGKTL